MKTDQVNMNIFMEDFQYLELGAGAIGMSEMLEILSTLHEMEGAPTDKIQTMATSMFSKATDNFTIPERFLRFKLKLSIWFRWRLVRTRS